MVAIFVLHMVLQSWSLCHVGVTVTVVACCVGHGVMVTIFALHVVSRLRLLRHMGVAVAVIVLRVLSRLWSLCHVGIAVTFVVLCGVAVVVAVVMPHGAIAVVIVTGPQKRKLVEKREKKTYKQADTMPSQSVVGPGRPSRERATTRCVPSLVLWPQPISQN